MWVSGTIPLLVRRGGCASNKMLRSHRSGADGVVAYDSRFGVSDHPVRSTKGGFAPFFLMSRPPLLTRRGISLATTISLLLTLGPHLCRHCAVLDDRKIPRHSVAADFVGIGRTGLARSGGVRPEVTVVEFGMVGH